MSRGVVVVTGEEGNAAAREAAAVAQQQPSTAREAQLERAIESAIQQATTKAADAAQRAKAAEERAAQVQVTTEVPTPQTPRITIERDGKTIVIPTGAPTGAAVTQGPDFVMAPQIPTEAVVISIAFFVTLAFIIVLLPLARALARRADRQPVRAASAPFPADVADRIARIEHAVEAIAIEVERVSEGQRFTTKLLSDMRTPAGLSAGAPGQYGGEGR